MLQVMKIFSRKKCYFSYLIGVYITHTCLHDGPLSGCTCEPSDYISLPPHKTVLIDYPRGSFIMWAILYSNTDTRETITENTEDICCPALYECEFLNNKCL